MRDASIDDTVKTMPKMLIFGLGYAAKVLAESLRGQGWSSRGTGRDGDLDFADRDSVGGALAQANHVLSSVPPDADGHDPVLAAYGNALSGKWLGYLSSTGVYGDSGGAWVDETAPIGGGAAQRADRIGPSVAGARRAGVPAAGHLRTGAQPAGPRGGRHGAPHRPRRPGV